MGLQAGPAPADALGVVEGWPEGSQQVFRPRVGTAKVSALVCAAFLALTIVTGARGTLVYAAIPFMFFVQCFQHVEVAGNRARRTGLRAVDLDLTTARIAATGRSWWAQLFFLGRCLELRDADGRGLMLEAWLWSASTRQALVEAVVRANPPERNSDAGAPHS